MSHEKSLDEYFKFPDQLVLRIVKAYNSAKAKLEERTGGIAGEWGTKSVKTALTFLGVDQAGPLPHDLAGVKKLVGQFINEIEAESQKFKPALENLAAILELQKQFVIECNKYLPNENVRYQESKDTLGPYVMDFLKCFRRSIIEESLEHAYPLTNSTEGHTSGVWYDNFKNDCANFLEITKTLKGDNLPEQQNREVHQNIRL